MEKLDVEFELFRKRVYNLEIRSFYLLLLNRGCDIKTLRALFSERWMVCFIVLNRIEFKKC